MIDKSKFPLVLTMIQPEPMPGTYLNNGMTFETVVQIAMDEVRMISDLGFDGYIIQNRNDAPIKQIAEVETVAYMSVLSHILKQAFPHLVQGILVNWDGVASLAVADAAGADFIRVEHVYTGVEVGYAGMIEAQCVDVLKLKKKIGSKMPVYADVYEIHYEQIGAKTIDAAAWDSVKNAFADGLFVGGRNHEESIEFAKKVRAKLGDSVPLFLSGGATADNIEELLDYYDGVSVGTWVKNGNMRNPIDPEKAKLFITRAKNRVNGKK